MTEFTSLTQNSTHAPRALLAKASYNAARQLGLNQSELAEVIGVSNAVVSGIARQNGQLPADPKKLELAALFVRVFRALDAIVGGDAASARSWMRAENTALNAVPADRIKTAAGLVEVLNYLDARRAPV